MSDIRELTGLAGDGQTARVDDQATSLGRMQAQKKADAMAQRLREKHAAEAIAQDVPAYVLKWRRDGSPAAKVLADGSVGYYDRYRSWTNLPASARPWLGL